MILTNTDNDWTFVVDVSRADVTDDRGIDCLNPGVQLWQGQTTTVAQHLSETRQMYNKLFHSSANDDDHSSPFV